MATQLRSQSKPPSSLPRRFSITKRSISSEETVNQVELTSRPENNQRSQSSDPKAKGERRRSFLGSRESFSKRLPKNINANLLYSTSPKISLSSSDYVKRDRQPPVTSVSDRHSIAVAPMAYRKATASTNFQHQERPQLQLKTNKEYSEEQASICHSPTWGDEKSKKKSSGWAWRRNSQSKPKKEEEELQQQSKPIKRLNKKPPPAMETQRKSSSFANGSGSSESLHAERPSSSGSLTKAMRGFLSRRSSQGSASDLSRPPSVKALRYSSQESDEVLKADTRHAEKIKYEEDEAYVNDIADFVNQMEASARAALAQPSIRFDSAPHALTPASIPPQGRVQESPLPPIPAQQTKPLPPRSTSVPASISRIFGKRDNAAGGYKYPALGNKVVMDRSMGEHKANQDTWLTRNFGAKHSPSAVMTHSDTSHASGYVQRQRMVQQQRSIMGFQDELAVKSAYDQFVSESETPPVTKESTEVLQPSQAEPPSQFREQTNDRGNQVVNGIARNDTDSRKPLPPPKTVGQYKALPSPETRPLPATPPQLQKQSSASQIRTVQKNVRPDPQVVQSSKDGAQNHSSPNVIPTTRSQLVEPSRQSKESTLTMASSSTGTSHSSVSTQKIPPTYQLPPVASSQTSPTFSPFSEPSSEGISPPALNLDDNPIRLVSSNTAKDLPQPPVPKTTIPPLTRTNELLVASENAEGILRKTSIKRHRSDPELKIPELKVDQSKPDLPSLDFLPELRHQAFTKPKRTSRLILTPGSPPQPPLSPSQFPIPSPGTEVAKRPVGQMRASKRASVVGAGAIIGSSAMPAKPIAKLFVICCQCKFWHDLPSKLYEAMALPQAVGKEDNIGGNMHQHTSGDHNASIDGEVKGFQGQIFTQVKCPWCPHCLSTSCCQGWTAITYLHERHH